MTLGSDMLLSLFLQYVCTFLSYKERVFNGPEVRGSGPVTHAKEPLVPRVSEIWPTHHVKQNTFLSPYDKPKPRSWKTEATTLMDCMQRPGETEGIAGAECLLSEMSRGPHARSQGKKIFQQPSLSVWSWGQGKGGDFPLTTNPAVVLSGQVSEEYHALPRGPEEEHQPHISSDRLRSRQNRQHRQVVTWYFSFNPCPMIYWCIGVSRASDHKFHFSILEVQTSVKSLCKLLNYK